MFKSLIIFGAGGHGKVILDSAVKAGFAVEGFLDDMIDKKNILGFDYLGTISDINKFAANYVFVCAIGENVARQKISTLKGIKWVTIVHPAVQIGLDVEIGSGTVVMAGVVINTSSRIGRHCIINTGAVVEHDCIISDYAHISPNATLCGGVTIGKGVWIGAGAVIKNGVSVCAEAVIGAGAVVVKNITEKGTYIDVPAKKYGGKL